MLRDIYLLRCKLPSPDEFVPCPRARALSKIFTMGNDLIGFDYRPNGSVLHDLESSRGLPRGAFDRFVKFEYHPDQISNKT